MYRCLQWGRIVMRDMLRKGGGEEETDGHWLMLRASKNGISRAITAIVKS